MSSVSSVSIMISTKDRPEDVKALLDNLSKQTVVPAQIVIVDASAQDALSNFLAATTFPFECQYIHTTPGVMRQRNLGIARCTGDFIFSLDDDILPAPKFIEEMISPLQQDSVGAIIAVTGRIVDDRKWAVGLSWRGQLYYVFRNLVAHIFLLDKAGSGQFRYSGLGTYPRDPSGRFVECLAGGCVVFRRTLFDKFRYDENIYYPLLEDLDTSKRLKDMGCKVYYQPSAQVLHKKSLGGRASRASFYRVWVTHYYYIFTKNWPQTPLRKLAFWWSVFGQLVLTAIYPEQFKGVLAGISNIRQAKTAPDAMKNLVPAA